MKDKTHIHFDFNTPALDMSMIQNLKTSKTTFEISSDMNKSDYRLQTLNDKTYSSRGFEKAFLHSEIFTR